MPQKGNRPLPSKLLWLWTRYASLAFRVYIANQLRRASNFIPLTEAQLSYIFYYEPIKVVRKKIRRVIINATNCVYVKKKYIYIIFFPNT